MDRYMLSNEGRAKFRRMRTSSDSAAKIENYEILNYLYEHGAATVEDIENRTGLSLDQVMNKLSTLIYHGYIEELAK
jgi:DNA-binding MarR family transcriptional regulator